MAHGTCGVCGAAVEAHHLASAKRIDPALAALIEAEHPGWEARGGICPKCREEYRKKKFLAYLGAQYHELNDVEQKLINKMARRSRVSRPVNQEFEQKLTFGQRLADRVAEFGGSWAFIILFGAIMLGWIAINTFILFARHPFDPYPYILLNLFLSMMAAVQAPVIMMSQNRQSAKDRLQAAHDYEVNLMAEMEIRDLHEKLDGLRIKQWKELWEMQQRQLELLEMVQNLLKTSPSSPAAHR